MPVRSTIYLHKNPEKAKLYNLRKWQRTKEKRQYPVSALCYICGKFISGNEINYDHDHETGLFRGWLCRSCNTMLGWFERRKERIMEYLR